MAVGDDELLTETEIHVSSETALDGTFRVIVAEGPDRGASMSFDANAPSRILVGQSPACSLRLTDREVSRRHAALEVVAGGIRITDLDSTNGTFVDRVKIVEAILTGGEIVRVGTTMLSIEFDTGAPPVGLPEVLHFGNVLGRSHEMRRLYPLCAKLAASEVPLVIEGETGTGKELLAESIHQESARAREPFVVFDCTTAPPNLVESELFGHERGAFTGAVTARRGVFEQAHGGTLLIDEIGDLDIALQAKLLRAIERREVRRIGGAGFTKVDVRVIAATRRDLDREVAAGRFRDDLFHRLAVARIELPPLRRRRGDVTLLAELAWRDLGGEPSEIPRDALARWEEHTWPGNVRELRNAVARLHALGELASQTRGPLSVPPSSSPAPSTDGFDDATKQDVVEEVLSVPLPFAEARARVMEDFERRYVGRLLDLHGGDLARAAVTSGIGRRYFQMLKAKVRK
jgi:two-component system, NtrC family, response regulator HydG